MKFDPLTISSLFALLCTLVNWHSVWVHKNLQSTTMVSLDGASLFILGCVVLLVFIIRSIYQSIRICLDRGIRIPSNIKFIDWRPCLLALPALMFHWSGVDERTLPDGILFTHTFGYGSSSSGFAFLSAILTILTYQIAAQLFPYRRKNPLPTATAWV